MKKFALFLLFSVLTLWVFQASARDYLITEYGVSVDSTRLNTRLIQRVIDKAAADGGGTIVIPRGVFLTGALFFKPHTHLRLAKGAKLKGSDNIDDYPLIPSRMEGHNLYYYAALINAYYVDSFSIRGPGNIDGNGLKFWKAFWSHRDSVRKAGGTSTNLEVHRPRLLFIWGCNNVTIRNVGLHNSGFWTTHLYQCHNVLIDSCDIRSPFAPVPAPSTDGVDIDVCTKVTVKNCYISVNDDGVCIKGGKGPNAQSLPGNGATEDVLVENCTYGRVHAVLTLGSECIHAKNITIRNCKVETNSSILHLKMRPDTYQVYENITVEGITGKCGSVISMAPWTQFFDMKGSKARPFAIVRNVTIKDIHVECKSFGRMQGNPHDQVSHITFKNIQAKADKATFATSYKDIKLENVMVNGKALILPK